MTKTTAEAQINLGLTLFSLTNEWLSGRYTLIGLLDQVGATGIGPGVEVVGFQSFRGFPTIDHGTIKEFREALDRNGLVATSMGSNTDVALRRDRFLSTDESVDYLSAQIDAAKLLGFPIMRIQLGTRPEVIERLEPLAADAGVVLGMEVHAPDGPNTPGVLAVRKCYDRLSSAYLGFIPDFSATMRSIPDGAVTQLTSAGLSAAGVELLDQHWRADGTPADRFREFAEAAAATGENPTAVGQARLMFSMFGRQDPMDWREVLPQIVHVHAKFYDIDSDGTEQAIAYPELLSVLREGYRGYLSTEWEGHAWAGLEVDAFELVQRHHAMCRRLLQPQSA